MKLSDLPPHWVPERVRFNDKGDVIDVELAEPSPVYADAFIRLTPGDDDYILSQLAQIDANSEDLVTKVVTICSTLRPGNNEIVAHAARMLLDLLNGQVDTNVRAINADAVLVHDPEGVVGFIRAKRWFNLDGDPYGLGNEAHMQAIQVVAVKGGPLWTPVPEPVSTDDPVETESTDDP